MFRLRFSIFDHQSEPVIKVDCTGSRAGQFHNASSVLSFLLRSFLPSCVLSHWGSPIVKQTLLQNITQTTKAVLSLVLYTKKTKNKAQQIDEQAAQEKSFFAISHF